MKRHILASLLGLFSVLSFAPSAPAQNATVSGDLSTIFHDQLQGDAFVRVRLRNYSGCVPRISGAGGIIAETTKEVSPDVTGHFSTTLVRNDFVDTCGVTSRTFYSVEYWNNGIAKSTANYQCSAPTCDLNTLATFNPQPPPVNILNAVLTNPSGGQTVTQPLGSTFSVVTGKVDFSTAAGTAPIKTGLLSAIPSSCLANKELYVPTDVAEIDLCNGTGNGFVSISGGLPGVKIVDGIRYTTIAAAVAAAGSTGSVLIPPTYAGTDVDPNANKIQIIDLRKGPNRQRGFINMLTDCGLKGDGVTDDSTNANACFALYPGYEFYFPKTQPNGTCSYMFNSTLTPTGAGVIIRGGGGGGSYISTTHLGGTELCFNGVTGIMLDNVGHSATVQDISLNGLAGTQLQSAPTLVNLPPVSPLYSRNISSIQRSTQVLTVTVSVLGAEGLSAQVGSILQIAGVTGDATMNGTCVVASVSNTSTNPLTFTCSQNGADSGPFGAVGTVLPYTTGTSTADGIRVCGNFHTIRHVGIGFFGRHGINAASNETGCVAAFSDDLVVRDSVLSNNQGFNIFMRGVDSNAGEMSGNSLYYAGLWGAYDSSFLGNNWFANQASYNGLSNASLGVPATKNISAISRTSGTVSVTLATADTNIKVGSAVVIAGVTDSSFNTTANSAFFVTVRTDSTHYQYIQPGAPVDASSSGGTSRMAKFQEAVLASGLDNGAYKVGPSSSVWNQGMAFNYVEGGQACKFGPSVINIGGSNIPSGCVPNNGADFAGLWMTTGVTGFPGSFSSNLRLFTENKDNVNGYDLRFRAGISGGSTRSVHFNYYDNNTNLPSWSQTVDPTGTTAGEWRIARGSGGSGGVNRIRLLGATNSNGLTRINSESTGAVEINKDANTGTGGLVVCSGGASPTCPASPVIDSANTHFAAVVKSATANPASAGFERLAKTDVINFRNNANSADITALAIDGSDNLLLPTVASLTSSGTVTGSSIATGGDSFSNTPRIAWTCFLPGALTSTWTGCQFTPKKAVTVVQVELAAKTAPVTCTPNAVVRVTDATSNQDTTLNAGQVTNNIAGGQNYAANAVLQVKVLTAAAGCGTSPADVNVTVQYKMQ